MSLRGRGPFRVKLKQITKEHNMYIPFNYLGNRYPVRERERDSRKLITNEITI